MLLASYANRVELSRIHGRSRVVLRLDHRPSRKIESGIAQSTREFAFRLIPSRLLIGGIGEHCDPDPSAPDLLDSNVDIAEGQRNTDESHTPRLIRIVSTPVSTRIIQRFLRRTLIEGDPPAP